MSFVVNNVQVLFAGLALGSIYALVALGFVLIVRATNVVNFAQGDFAMAGGFASGVKPGADADRDAKTARGMAADKSEAAKSKDTSGTFGFSPPGAVVEALRETVHIVERTGQFMKRFAVGREDKCQLGGPVKIADMAGRAAALGFQWLVQLVALLSVGIGILNLLPIPPLDGGHLLFYGIEAVFRRPVSERVMEMVYRAGFTVVLLFMGFVFWNDLFGC